MGLNHVGGAPVPGAQRPARPAQRYYGPIMQIQINTDASIDANARLIDHLKGEVQTGLDRFATRLSRVELHVTDENRAKGGPDDKRCVLEARIQGQNPLAVTHNASTVNDAVKGAMEKMCRMLDSTFGRLHSHR